MTTIDRSRAMPAPRGSTAPLRGVKVLGALLGAALLVVAPVSLSTPATAADAPVVVQCNGTDNVGGETVECEVTVVNNLDMATGETSSTTTVRECHGAANAPPTCVTTPTGSDQLVTSVDQCNGSSNGGGGTVRCTVDVTNNITGSASPTAATINQCNAAGEGGGTEPTTACNPFPATTTDATVTQCNEAGNGGGADRRVRCSVGTDSTHTAVVPVTIDQCIGSGNGGGADVECRATITNNVLPAGAPDGGGTPEGEDDSTPPDTDGTIPVASAPVPSDPAAPADRTNGPGTSSRTSRGSDSSRTVTADGTPTTIAVTGSNTTPLALAGALAILLGGVLVTLARRPTGLARTGD